MRILIVLGPVDPEDSGITLKSHGIGIQDVAAAHMVYQEVLRLGLGTMIDLQRPLRICNFGVPQSIDVPCIPSLPCTSIGSTRLSMEILQMNSSSRKMFIEEASRRLAAIHQVVLPESSLSLAIANLANLLSGLQEVEELGIDEFDPATTFVPSTGD